MKNLLFALTLALLLGGCEDPPIENPNAIIAFEMDTTGMPKYDTEIAEVALIVHVYDNPWGYDRITSVVRGTATEIELTQFTIGGTYYLCIETASIDDRNWLIESYVFKKEFVLQSKRMKFRCNYKGEIIP